MGAFERLICLDVKGDDNNITDEEWEELGRSNVANKIHVGLRDGALNDHKISYLFRGLRGAILSKP